MATTTMVMVLIGGAMLAMLLTGVTAWYRRVQRQRRVQERLHRFCGAYLSLGSARPLPRVMELRSLTQRAA